MKVEGYKRCAPYLFLGFLSLLVPREKRTLTQGGFGGSAVFLIPVDSSPICATSTSFVLFLLRFFFCLALQYHYFHSFF